MAIMAQYTGGKGGGASSDSSASGTVVNGPTAAPGNNTSLIVDANTAITNSPTLNSITINPGKKLTINNGQTVTIPSNGKVRLKAQQNNYSQLRIVGGLTLGTGATLIQEQNVSRTGWYNLGSSITNGVTTFGTVNAAAPGATTNTSNLKYWDAATSQWVNVTDLDAITPGRGYNAFVGTFGVAPANSKISLEGTPITTVTPTINYHNPGGISGFGAGFTDGWNFLANPFAASLDFDALTLTNVEDAYYIWDAAANSGNGGYLSWSAAAGAGSDLTQFIPPLQGFWVRALGASPIPSIGTLDYATHTVENETPNFRKTDEILGHAILTIASAINDAVQDELTLAFIPGTSSGFDNGWDARKMYNPTPAVNFYTNGKGEALSINAINFDPNSHHTQIIPLGLTQTRIGEPYKIQLQEPLDLMVQAILEDVDSKKFHDLKQGAYTFIAHPQQLERFKLHLTTDPNWTATSSSVNFTAWVYQSELFISPAIYDGLANIRIYDLRGQLLHQKMTIELQENTLQKQNLNFLPTGGLYIVEIVAGKTIQYIKFQL